MTYPLETGEVRPDVCISGWNSTCQPYIESTTLLSYMDSNTDNLTRVCGVMKIGLFL